MEKCLKISSKCSVKSEIQNSPKSNLFCSASEKEKINIDNGVKCSNIKRERKSSISLTNSNDTKYNSLSNKVNGKIESFNFSTTTESNSFKGYNSFESSETNEIKDNFDESNILKTGESETKNLNPKNKRKQGHGSKKKYNKLFCSTQNQNTLRKSPRSKCQIQNIIDSSDEDLITDPDSLDLSIKDEETDDSSNDKKKKSKDSKRRHRKRIKKYGCEICKKKFVSENILKSHYHSHNGEKRFKCDICGKEYGWPSSFQIHMQTHKGDDTYKCHTCEKILCSKVTLQRHITRMHIKPDKVHVCDICSRTFMYSYELKYHKEKHFSKPEFICEFCGKILANKHYLAAHLRTHTGEKPFTCTICNKGFTWKSLMKQHMKIHIDGYCYQCEICGKQYSAQRSLARHFLLHTDERPYKCKLCDKAFKCGSALASHKDYHLGIKRHKCEFCGKEFLSESNMHKHKKRHIGIKNHKCSICEKAFITKQELQMHMRSHSGNKNKKKCKEPYLDESSFHNVENELIVANDMLQMILSYCDETL